MKPFFGIGALAFFSLLLFGSGVFLHGSKPPPQAAADTGKSAAKAVHGKGKLAAKAAPKDSLPKDSLPQAAEAGVPAENSLAFPLLLAGGAGLLVSAIAGLVLSYGLRAPTPEAARRIREAERTAQRKQQEEFHAQQEALQSQLLDAKQRKAETEALRDQVSRQFQEFFRTLPVPCFCFAANGRIIRWNAACEALYGIPAASALESTLWETIVPAEEREEAEAKISRVLTGESLFSVERRDTVAGGKHLPLRCSMVPLYDADGLIIGGLSAGVDVTEFSAVQEQVAALTRALETAQTAPPLAQAAPSPGVAAEQVPAAVPAESSPELGGHSAFRTRLMEEIERSARYHAPLSLVLLDLDGFTARNRSFGFEAGDQVLETAVAMIKSKIRTVDVLVRLGADEYAVILPETGEAGARVAADRLRSGIASVSPAGQPALSACLGVALLTAEVSGTAMLVTRAQDALTQAQSCGPGSVTHYQDLIAHLPGILVPAPTRQRRSPIKAAKL